MDKLKKIDEILSDDSILEKYIYEIEKNKTQVPANLEKRINLTINKNKKNKYTCIFKIAACLIFSLAICRTDFIKNDNFKKYEFNIKTTNITKNEKISEFCEWLKTPLELEKEEL